MFCKTTEGIAQKIERMENSEGTRAKTQILWRRRSGGGSRSGRGGGWRRGKVRGRILDARLRCCRQPKHEDSAFSSFFIIIHTQQSNASLFIDSLLRWPVDSFCISSRVKTVETEALQAVQGLMHCCKHSCLDCFHCLDYQIAAIHSLPRICYFGKDMLESNIVRILQVLGVGAWIVEISGGYALSCVLLGLEQMVQTQSSAQDLAKQLSIESLIIESLNH